MKKIKLLLASIILISLSIMMQTQVDGQWMLQSL